MRSSWLSVGNEGMQERMDAARGFKVWGLDGLDNKIAALLHFAEDTTGTHCFIYSEQRVS